MKNKIPYTVAMSAVMSVALFGQPIKLGAQFGANFSTIVGGSTTGLEHITTFGGGAFAEVSVAKNLSLRPELNYITKGFKETAFAYPAILGPHPTDYSSEWSYLEFPILLKWTPAPWSSDILTPNLFFGPEVAFQLTAKSGANYSDGTSETYTVANAKSTDFGLVAGIGANVDLSTLAITLDIRFDLGLKHIPQSGFTDATNSCITVDLGLEI